MDHRPRDLRTEGFNRTIIRKEEAHEKEHRWFTEEQLAGPRCFNSAAHAKLLTADLPSQPSRYASMAKAGVLEYQLTEELYREMTGKRSEAGVSSESELKVYEYKRSQAKHG